MNSIVADRRALHRIPELDRSLDRTMAYLREALAPLDCALSSPIPGSLCAYFDNGMPRTLAFRSDADALPVQEETHLPFASGIPGRMHACGHDGHMAMLLELARRLNRAQADYNFLLIFQPAEETTGGARDVCESGVLRKCNAEAVFGMHLWPGLPAGQIASRAGEMMSRSCEVTAQIEGRASHIARAEEGRDALRAGVELVRRAGEIEAAWPEHIFRLLRFGRMESGSVRNAVSDHTRLEGTLRAFQDEVFFAMLDALREACADIEAASGCRVRLSTSDGYPAVINPPELCDRVRACGADYLELPRPVMITEDFSWYQRYLPGMFFFLGTGDTPALHSGAFNFDETILEAGADFWERLALNFHESHTTTHRRKPS